ncbi:uncharacterized protein ACA1_156320 [Acanthamoeba castellanii str. Neff]|uniref:Uncharacterized protein n=1 Tax=Acanthamoeba castellanii (strain ATCC 30010 / Neff) TaxID=1257118 RepID=L8GHH2_ACACF|nr:uncharacterized protein ACA1_156320 [Acanthamoeba castellanii str. Neff]ELR12530.1 hypothetical protein ACA1_156320 [Acanthamoeba castellanii str. Neff]
MSDNLTQSTSGILSMVMTCHNAAELAKWMVKQLEWKKWKESNLKKKSLGELQNMCMNYFTSVAEVEKNKAKLTELHKQIQAGNKYKISKDAFKELLIACQRCVEFLSKVRKVATHLMDRDFIHLKNKVATGEWEQLLLILSNPHIKIKDVIQELQERIQKEKEEKEKAEEKEKHRAKAKESLLVQDIAKIPKLMAYEKPSLIKRWNLKWVHIAPQLWIVQQVPQEQEPEQELEQGQKPQL